MMSVQVEGGMLKWSLSKAGGEEKPEAYFPVR